MSRSGYSDDGENPALWRQAVNRAIRGKRGQAFLREMAAALDAMPVKALVGGDVVREDGSVCAIGSVAVARKTNVADLDIYDPYEVGDTFGIAGALAAEIAYLNDGELGYVRNESPEARWTRMRKWVAEQLPQEEPAHADE